MNRIFKGKLIEIIGPFCELTSIKPEKFAKILFNRFKVDDRQFSDGMIRSTVLDYFERKLIPHKIEVYRAGLEILEMVAHSQRKEYFENLWLHDLSKFSAIESIPYSFHDFSKNEFSPEMKIAWVHHKCHNEHHPEYWLNPSKSGKLDPVPMSDIYIVEMVADWIGAGRTYGNEIDNWLPDNLHKFLWHEETTTKVGEILEWLGFTIIQDGNKLRVDI